MLCNLNFKKSIKKHMDITWFWRLLSQFGNESFLFLLMKVLDICAKSKH